MGLQLKIKVPGQSERLVSLEPMMILGSLASNNITLEAKGIDPIHALLEAKEGGGLILTDLGSSSGVRLNGQKIRVEAKLKEGDLFSIGPVELSVLAEPVKPVEKRRPDNLLFTPRNPKATGGVLEVVAYWDDKVIDVEHFHPTFPKFQKATIGSHLSANFISGGPLHEDDKPKVLAEAGERGFSLSLYPGMSARVLRKGKFESLQTGQYELGWGDVAHVAYGPIRYFLIFKALPKLELPPRGIRDPLFTVLMSSALVLYTLTSVVLYTSTPLKPKPKDEVWAVVQLPPKPEPVKPEPLPVAKEVLKPEPPAPVPAPEPAPVPEPPPPPPAPVPKPEPAPKPVPKPAPAPKALPSAHKAESPKHGTANLGQLGLGVGKLTSASGAGAIASGFTASTGGGDGGDAAPRGSKRALGDLGGTKAIALGGADSPQFNSEGAAQELGQSFGKGRNKAKIDLNGRGADVSGGLTAKEIGDVVRAHLGEVRGCYEKFLQIAPGASGRVKVNFVVGGSGAVASAKVVSSDLSGDDSLQDCLTGLVRRWNFPAPRGGADVTVSYPFVFTPL